MLRVFKNLLNGFTVQANIVFQSTSSLYPDGDYNHNYGLGEDGYSTAVIVRVMGGGGGGDTLSIYSVNLLKQNKSFSLVL